MEAENTSPAVMLNDSVSSSSSESLVSPMEPAPVVLPPTRPLPRSFPAGVKPPAKLSARRVRRRSESRSSSYSNPTQTESAASGSADRKQPAAEPALPFRDRLARAVEAALATTDDAGENATHGHDADEEQRRAVAVATAEAIISGSGSKAGETARTLLMSLSDPLNADLRQRLLDGRLLPEELVGRSAYELANPQVQSDLAKVRESRNRSRNMQTILAETAPRTDLYQCTHCGMRNAVMLQREKAKPWFSGGEGTADVMCTCLECGRGFRVE